MWTTKVGKSFQPAAAHLLVIAVDSLWLIIKITEKFFKTQRFSQDRV